MFEERKWVGRYGTVVYSSRSAWRKVGRRRTYSMPGSLHGGWGPLDKWAGEPRSAKVLKGSCSPSSLYVPCGGVKGRWEDRRTDRWHGWASV